MAWYVDGVFCVMQHDVCYGMILYDMVNGKVYTVPVVPHKAVAEVSRRGKL